jgi:hypothetical protein
MICYMIPTLVIRGFGLGLYCDGDGDGDGDGDDWFLTGSLSLTRI